METANRRKVPLINLRISKEKAINIREQFSYTYKPKVNYFSINN